jgi:hemerythrin-like domain-containing protein
MDIFTSLKNDHETIKNLLNQLENNPRDASLFERLKIEMTSHNQAEEETFYDFIRKKIATLDIIVEASDREHYLVDEILYSYSDIEEVDDETKRLIFSILKKSIEAHINKEEIEVFAIARKNMSLEEINEINSSFSAKKKEIKENLIQEEAATTIIEDQEDS